MQRRSLSFDWKGFELHPEIPLGGVAIRALLPGDRVDAMLARLHDVAASLDVPFSPQEHAPNTKAALAISELARREGVLDSWRTAAMDAYWRDGRDIEDRTVLAELAKTAGLDPDAAIAFLDAPEVPALLLEQRHEAMRWGVDSIPTWFMLPAGWTPTDPMPPEGQPRPVKVVGCQPAEVVERAAEMAGA